MKQLVLGLVSIISVVIILITVFTIQGRSKVETTQTMDLSTATEQAINDALLQGDFESYVSDATLSDAKVIELNNEMTTAFADSLVDSVATASAYSKSETTDDDLITNITYTADEGATGDANFKLEINIITSDIEKGIFAVETIQSFTGTTGAVETSEVTKTTILEQSDEAEVYNVEYFYPEAIGSTLFSNSNVSIGTINGKSKPTKFKDATVVEGDLVTSSTTPQDIVVTEFDGTTTTYTFSGWAVNTTADNYFESDDQLNWFSSQTMIDSTTIASDSITYSSDNNDIQLIACYVEK